MDKKEMALQLTLKALETPKLISIEHYSCDTREQHESQNAFNAKQIANFYNALVNQMQ